MFKLIRVILVMVPLALLGSECVPPAVDGYGLTPIVVGDRNAATRQQGEIDAGLPARWPALMWGDPDGFQNLAESWEWTLTSDLADYFGQPGTAQPGRSFYIQTGSVEAIGFSASWAQTSRDYRRDMNRIVAGVLDAGVEVVVVVGSPRYMGDIDWPESYQWYVDQKNEHLLELAISDRVVCDAHPLAICIDTFALLDSRSDFEDDGRTLSAAGQAALATAVPEPGQGAMLLFGLPFVVILARWRHAV